MKIDLSCSGCGSNRFSLEHAQTDECVVECEDCGRAVGTLGDLKRRLAAMVSGRAAIEQVQPAE